MRDDLKKLLRPAIKKLRQRLEGYWLKRPDGHAEWRDGDIYTVLKQHGIFPDREWISPDTLGLEPAARQRREKLEEAMTREIERAREKIPAAARDRENRARREATRVYAREVAFTWLNRLFGLKCLESRGMFDDVITTREAYAGRSYRHYRFLQEHAGRDFGPDDHDGLKTLLHEVFAELRPVAGMVFDPDDELSIIAPSNDAIQDCVRILNNCDPAMPLPPEVYAESDVLGWAYQYFNEDEKNRVFEGVRNKKKIEGEDIIPATCIYTEEYMVRFLVQNSLGAIWMEMYPQSTLCQGWEYFAKDPNNRTRPPKPVSEITFLDPACGSGHFLIVAFDLFAQMYDEERQPNPQWAVPPEKVAVTILEKNLHGIDIDLRACQIAYLNLYMKMREHQRQAGLWQRAEGDSGTSSVVRLDLPRPAHVNIVPADASLLQGPQWEEFVAGFSREPSVGRVLKALAGKLGNLKEIGSLARPEVDLRTIIHDEKLRWAEAVRTRKEKNYLFPEMKPPEQLELSFESAISDEKFWDELYWKVQAALHGFYEVSRAQGRVRAAVFATDAERGFEFMDLCLRRYDVVATNPPYMGSKNMNGGLKEFVQASYPEGKRDLYAAFILRCMQLARRDGYVAMVTQHSWMFLRSFARLRALPEGELPATPRDAFKGLLRETSIRDIAHLGPCAFSEVSGEVVNSVLFTTCKTPPDERHHFTALRLVGLRSPAEKQAALFQNTGFLRNGMTSIRPQHVYTTIREAPLPYWLSTELTSLLCGKHKLMDIADVKAGLSTAQNDRFLRFHWEVNPGSQRWLPYLKGGRYQKWAGLQWLTIDWWKDGAAVRLYPKAVVRNSDSYACTGLTYSLMSCGSMGVRINDGCIFDDTSLSVFPHCGVARESVAGFMNARLISFMLRTITQDLKFRVGYVALTPLPAAPGQFETQLEAVRPLAARAIDIKRHLVSHDMVELSFDLSCLEPHNSLHDSLKRSQEWQLRQMAILHSVEGQIEQIVVSAYQVNQRDVRAILSETGTPAGWHRVLPGFDTLPELGEFEIPGDVLPAMDGPVNSQDGIVQRLQQAYENSAEPSEAQDDPDVVEQPDQDEDGQTEEEVLGASIPIPCETLLEKLSTDLELHPVSVYLLIKEGIEKRGWRCPTEERRDSEGYVSVMTLRLLGHRWPKQIEAGEPVPDWADGDGIIPIVREAGEATLLDRIRGRLGEEFKQAGERAEDAAHRVEGEFQEIMGKSLESWLEKDFFRRHVSQFKRRPIAWHLTSANGTFQVMIYCHKLGPELLRTLLNTYLRPVINHYVNELRKARSGQATALSAGQLADIVGIDTAGRLVSGELFDFQQKIESLMGLPFAPDINDGVRVNIAPFQRLGLLACNVLNGADVANAIADGIQWHFDDFCSAPVEEELSRNSGIAAVLLPGNTRCVADAIRERCAQRQEKLQAVFATGGPLPAELRTAWDPDDLAKREFYEDELDAGLTNHFYDRIRALREPLPYWLLTDPGHTLAYAMTPQAARAGGLDRLRELLANLHAAEATELARVLSLLPAFWSALGISGAEADDRTWAKAFLAANVLAGKRTVIDGEAIGHTKETVHARFWAVGRLLRPYLESMKEKPDELNGTFIKNADGLLIRIDWKRVGDFNARFWKHVRERFGDAFELVAPVEPPTTGKARQNWLRDVCGQTENEQDHLQLFFADDLENKVVYLSSIGLDGPPRVRDQKSLL